MASGSSLILSEENTACKHLESTEIRVSDMFITLSSVHGNAFAKQHALRNLPALDHMRVYANADVECIRPAVNALVELGWTPYTCGANGILFEITSPTYGIKLGGLRIQLPAYTDKGHILFSDMFRRVEIDPPSRYRQDEQVITETYTFGCAPLTRLLAALQFIFPGHVVALRQKDGILGTPVMQLMPGPVVMEWIHGIDEREQLERIMAVGDEAQDGLQAHKWCGEVAGALLQARGFIPPPPGQAKLCVCQ
jgi:hypothetical protein